MPVLISSSPGCDRRSSLLGCGISSLLGDVVEPFQKPILLVRELDTFVWRSRPSSVIPAREIYHQSLSLICQISVRRRFQKHASRLSENART